MKEKISRGLKRDQLFRVNASGRKHKKQSRTNPNRTIEYKGKLFFWEEMDAFEKWDTNARRQEYIIWTNWRKGRWWNKKNTMQINKELMKKKKVDGSILEPFDWSIDDWSKLRMITGRDLKKKKETKRIECIRSKETKDLDTWINLNT